MAREDDHADCTREIECLQDTITELSCEIERLRDERLAFKALLSQARECHGLWLLGHLTRQNGMLQLERAIKACERAASAERGAPAR